MIKRPLDLTARGLLALLPLLPLLALLVAACPQPQGPRIKHAERVKIEALRGEQWRLPRLLKKHRWHRAVFLRVRDHFSQDVDELAGYLTRRERQLRYLVLNADQQSLTTFKLRTERGERLEWIELVAVFPDGSHQRFGPSDLIISPAGQGRTSYRMVYPRVVRGTLIEEQYGTVKRQTDLASTLLRQQRFWLQYGVPVEHLTVIYTTPWSWKIKSKSAALTYSFPLKTRATLDGLRHVYCVRKNVAPMPPEPFAGFDVVDRASLTFHVVAASLGQLYFRRPSDWHGLGRLVNRVLLSQPGINSPKLKQLTARVTRGLKTPRARARAILTHIRRKLRVQRSEGLRKQSLLEVLKRGRGSRFQLNVLAYRMFRLAGLPAHFTLIHSGRRGHFDADFVNLAELSEAAVAIGEGADRVLVFPDRRHLPLGFTPVDLQGQRAMTINAYGRVAFYTTAEMRGITHDISETYSLRVEPDGRLTVTHKETAKGFAAARLRRKLARQTSAQRLRTVQRRIPYHDASDGAVVTRISKLFSPDDPLEVVHRFSLKNRVFRAGGEAIIHLEAPPLASRVKLLATVKRHRPLVVPQAMRLVRRFELNIPRGWTPTLLPPSRVFKNAFGQLKLEVKKLPGRLLVTQTWLLNRTRHPASNAYALRQLLIEAHRASSLRVGFRLGAPRP